MAEYIEREATIDALDRRDEYDDLVNTIREQPAADVQEKRYCKMIPLEPDCRNYTDVFICTNCHNHIHLGFIRKEYSGSYCLECGAEVMDGDTMDKKQNLEQFLKELSELSAKYDLWIGGCGCCGSPYIMTGDEKTIADNLAVASDDTYYILPY